MRIVAMVTEEARLVQKYEDVRFSSRSFAFTACRFAPHPTSPQSHATGGRWDALV